MDAFSQQVNNRGNWLGRRQRDAEATTIRMSFLMAANYGHCCVGCAIAKLAQRAQQEFWIDQSVRAVYDDLQISNPSLRLCEVRSGNDNFMSRVRRHKLLSGRRHHPFSKNPKMMDGVM